MGTGDGGFVRDAAAMSARGAAAAAPASPALSPSTIACGGDCGSSLETLSLRGSGAAEGGEQQPSRGVRNGNGSSDARSRLSGAATGMVGGATAVVAIATTVGEVRRVWFDLSVMAA